MSSSCEHCGQVHTGASLFCPNTGKLIPGKLIPDGGLLEGKYAIGRTIGVGGMGAVFEARHVMLDKRVAVKVMIPEGDPQMVQQFSSRMVREARAASATGHRNIAQVTDMGWVREGCPFVVMEYLEGQTLRELFIGQEPLALERALPLMSQVLAGLEVVHRKGIVHRDLKPDNLMLVHDEEGQELIKILDFGISKVLKEGELELTSTGLVMGTPQYMSPEQAKASATVDHRTDIYSAGAILYHLVTGTLPHQQETLSALIAALLTEPIDPPSRRRPGLPQALDAAVLRALARDPAQRFASAKAFSEALQTLLAPGPHADAAAPATTPASPGSTGFAGFGEGLDESALVALDQTTDGPLAAAAPPPPAPAATPGVDPFAPPTAQADIPLEVSDGAPAAAGGADPFGPPPSAAAPPTTEDDGPLLLDRDQSLAAASLRASGCAPSAAAGASDKPRPSGPYGQALKRRPRTGLWIGLTLVVVGALVGLRFLLRDDSVSQADVAPTEASDNVKITINVTPRFADIRVDGVALTSQPLELRRSEREYQVTVRAKGYHSETRTIRPTEDQALQIDLRRRGATKTADP